LYGVMIYVHRCFQILAVCVPVIASFLIRFKSYLTLIPLSLVHSATQAQAPTTHTCCRKPEFSRSVCSSLASVALSIHAYTTSSGLCVCVCVCSGSPTKPHLVPPAHKLHIDTRHNPGCSPAPPAQTTLKPSTQCGLAAHNPANSAVHVVKCVWCSIHYLYTVLSNSMGTLHDYINICASKRACTHVYLYTHTHNYLSNRLASIHKSAHMYTIIHYRAIILLPGW